MLLQQNLFVKLSILLLLNTVFFPALLQADGPADNLPDQVRRIPMLGVEVPDEQKQHLKLGLAKLQTSLDQLKNSKNSRVQALIPDVEIYHRAVRCALEFQEFFHEREIGKGLELLKQGQQRADQLLKGEAPWTRQTGLVVRGYVSKIDNTVQPYGLVIPDNYTFSGKSRYRCDLWFHGRGERLSEGNFINQRQYSRGQYTPADTIVLHPYGRYSNAFKFAGEVDVLEALESTKQRYRIDDDRISVRGFSMGGAACWQFAVHYADRWFAANPGAGFSETPLFLKVFQKETLKPTWYEKKLWQLYDCPGYALNLYQCPTIAYSGELDSQKQAADVMEEALKKVGIDMVHIIGPKMGHRIHIDSKRIIEAKMDSLAKVGRQTIPHTVHLVAYTLKYNRMNWVTLDSMEEEWKQGQIDARLVPNNRVKIKTENVTGFTLKMNAGESPFDMTRPVMIQLDGTEYQVPGPLSDRSWHVTFHKTNDSWDVGAAILKPGQLVKRHNLQGPIDDAFMDSFIFVSPTGKSVSATVEKWVQSEMKHAVVHWRQQFRGDARVMKDTQITDQEIASSNLVLWGDPESNQLIKKIISKLPIQWNREEIVVGQKHFPAAHHAPILIFPNPLNPTKYVVLNSGFTYREYAYLNNARQVPMLPDWAIIDLRTPAGSQYPGKVVDADFFDENWQLK
ncbi:prolyl oligopeptidase family serine peptidase [Gimesia aquarii]|uniref:Prolyl oligopeptidase family protein n=1 Tax=Gimesia aquarii TaxID=2527964 RepID=A0A517W2M1_9PLAN|nr:prolyl oligopeptidase family serine peptidase [Gimesia aquarii]QDT99496.1 Prolyl oligopeptidase family protein [Gimesia aquarii]